MAKKKTSGGVQRVTEAMPATATTVLKSKQMTTTQPIEWITAWKAHMKTSGRTNLSAFIAEAVNRLISFECKRSKIESPVEGLRGSRGKKPTE